MTKTIENKLSREDEQKFDEILQLLLESEGGKLNNKNDNVGKTNRGISQRTYDYFCQEYGIQQKDVFDLTILETRVFYRTIYQASNCHQISDPQLAYAYFDSVVSLKTKNATKLLQKAIGGEVDGKMGKITLIKANSMNPKQLAQQLILQRRNFQTEQIKKKPSLKSQEKVWSARLDKINEIINKELLFKKLTQQSSRQTTASSKGSIQQQTKQNIGKPDQLEKNLGGIDCNPDISKLNKIKGIEKMNGRFLLDGQENIVLSDLITVLSVFANENIKPEHKGICFSLDPIILQNQTEVTQQEKVCWPDKFINRNVIQDTELAKIMFESDYLLKLMSLGVQSDGKTPFQFPKQLTELGLKCCLDYDNLKENGINRVLMFRFWLVPQKCSFSRKNDSYILNDIQVICQARQVERVKDQLQDKTVQDENDIAYKFAQKFTQLYDQIAIHYPIFNRLKQVFKAVALGKWMYQNNMKIDYQQMMVYNKKVNNNPKVIPVLKSERHGESTKTPIYFTEAEKIEKAKAYLKEKDHPITNDLVDKVVKQIPDLKGHEIQSKTLFTQGGIDPNCSIMEEKNWPTLKQNQDVDFEQIEIPFLPVTKCKDCTRKIENRLAIYNQDKCSIHNDYTCFLCLELITQNDKDPQGLIINNQKCVFHKDCYQEYQRQDQPTDDEDYY